MKAIKFFLLSLLMMVGIAAQAQQVQVTRTYGYGGRTDIVDADRIVYTSASSKPTFYYGMADRDVESLYVNGDVFTLPAGYKETTESEFTLRNDANTFDSSLYKYARSWYVVVPRGVIPSFVVAGLTASVDKKSYSYTDEFGDKFDVYVGISGTVYSSSWSLKVTINETPTFYYGMADQYIEDNYVNGDAFTLPGGYKATAESEFTLTKENTFDGSIYSRCRSWYVVVPSGTNVSFVESGIAAPYKKKSYSYTDEFGDKYDVYSQIYGGVLQSVWSLKVTIGDKQDYISLYKDGVMTRGYFANDVQQLEFLSNQPNDIVEARSASQAQIFNISDSPMLTIGNSNLTFADNTDNINFSRNEKVAFFIKGKEMRNLTFGASDYATYCTDVSLDFSEVDGIKAYIASSFNPNTGSLTITRVTNVPAGEGILLKGTAGESYDVPVTSDASVVANLMKGNTTSITLDPTTGEYTNFVLSQNSEGVMGFYRFNNSITMPAHKAWLQIPTSAIGSGSPAHARGFRFLEEGDEMTGIADIEENSANSDFIYDLQGRRLNSQPAHGLYIQNGKKIIK